MKKLFTILMIAITSLTFAKENTIITKTYSINNIKNISFETTNIPVKVIPTSGENIILTITNSDKLEIKEDQDGGELEVSVFPPKSFFKHFFNLSSILKNATIVIEIPEKYNNQLNIKTVNGNITVDGIKGIVKLKTTNGSIKATNVEAFEELHSTNGKIYAQGNELVKEGYIKTNNGDIELKINHLKGDNKITSTHSNIKLLTNEGELTINKFSKNEVEDTTKNILITTSHGSIDINSNKTK